MDIKFLDAAATYREFSRLLGSSTIGKIAVAYLKRNGVNQIINDVRRFLAKPNTSLEVTVGASEFYITEPDALRQLLQTFAKFHNLKSYYYYNEGFHPKLFYFEQEDRASVIIGSSNITAAALNENVEANVLIENEDTSSPFMNEVKSFLKDLDANRKPLTKRFIDDYGADFSKHRKRTSNARIRGRKKLQDTDKTPLPHHTPNTSLRLDTTNSLWKISPGRQAKQWPSWRDKIIRSGSDDAGVIAIGWGETGDLTELGLKAKEGVRDYIESRMNRGSWYKTKERAGDIARQLWFFYREVKPGDYVVVYSKTRIFAVGEVTSNYYFVTGKLDESGTLIEDGIYPHRRDIKILHYYPRGLRLTKRIIGILKKRPALYPVNNRDTTMVVRFIEQAYGANMVLDRPSAG